MSVAVLLLATVLLADVEGPPPELPLVSSASTLSQLKGADLALLDEIRRIAAKVETVRAEKFERPPLAVRVPEALRQVAAEIRAGAVLPGERLAARGRAWADLGLAQEDSPSLLLGLLASDVSGIGFDPAANRLLVGPERLSGEEFAPSENGAPDPATVLMMTGMRPDEPLVAHALMHLRQRERRGSDFLEATTDSLLAAAAWAEGEANLVAIRYLFQSMGIEDEMLKHSGDPGGFLAGELLPDWPSDLGPTVLLFLDFVYHEGFHQAVERYLAGGRARLDLGLGGPLTTRAVLHPERPGTKPARFAEPVAPLPGLELVDEDVLGEQGIIVLCSHLTAKDNLGLLAGQGWLGDSLRRWENLEGVGVTEWLIRWEVEQSARDFLYAIERGLTRRFGAQAFESGPGGTRRLLAGGALYEIRVQAAEATLRIVAPALTEAYGRTPVAAAPVGAEPARAN